MWFNKGRSDVQENLTKDYLIIYHKSHNSAFEISSTFSTDYSVYKERLL